VNSATIAPPTWINQPATNFVDRISCQCSTLSSWKPVPMTSMPMTTQCERFSAGSESDLDASGDFGSKLGDGFVEGFGLRILPLSQCSEFLFDVRVVRVQLSKERDQ
jgi:hypothetical protein